MSWSRIKAIIIQELFITKRSVEVLVDLFYFSIINLVVFGFVTLYIAGTSNKQTGNILLLGIILWEIIRVTQYSVSVGTLWNTWSRNLSNMFVAPLSFTEYMVAEILSGAIKAILTLSIICLLANVIFDFNLLQIGVANLVLFFINLSIFSWSIGILILALIFRYGTRIQAFAWSMIFIFQPLTAAYFPVTVLPQPIQNIAWFLPPTYVFEAARQSLMTQHVNWEMNLTAFILNIVYFLLTWIIFHRMFKASKSSGQFARNEG